MNIDKNDIVLVLVCAGIESLGENVYDYVTDEQLIRINNFYERIQDNNIPRDKRNNMLKIGITELVKIL